MLPVKIVYGVLLLTLAVFYVLYIDSLPLLFLICALLLPVVLKGGLLWLRAHAKGRVFCRLSTGGAGEDVPVTIALHNPSVLFFPRAEAWLEVVHSFGEAPETVRLVFPVHARNETSLTFHLKAENCGEVQVTLRRLRVYDLMGLCRVNLRITNRVTSILILPEPMLIPIENAAPPVDQIDSERYADRPGDDPSELFGIREYVPGDLPSRIHWKLSSRTDDLLVREMSRPVAERILLVADFRVSGRRAEDLRDAQHFLRAVYSVALELLEINCPFLLVWRAKGVKDAEGRLCRETPDSPDALAETFRKLYHTLFLMDEDTFALAQAFEGESFSSATLIANDGATPFLSYWEGELSANQRSMLLTRVGAAAPSTSLTEVRCLFDPAAGTLTV